MGESDLSTRLAIALWAVLTGVRDAVRENRPVSVEDALKWPDVLGSLREAGYPVDGEGSDD